MARRCLYFDSSDSDSSSSDESDTSDYGQPVPYKPGNGLQMCTFPGIALHLNSLMTTSKDGRMVLQDNPGSRIKVTKIPDFVGSPEVAQELHIQRDSWSVGGDAEVMEDVSCSPANETHEELNQSSQGLMIESWKATSDSSICMLPSMGLHLNALLTASMESPGSGMQLTIMRGSVVSRQVAQESDIKRDSRSVGVDAEVMQDGSCTRTAGTGERLDQFRKRHKSDAGENETYGFHNCKKSKCLKLYCECFTASAACQDCLDEDTVLATCKQENAKQNPASARHRNGCKCKKSRCPHKCCDCYQGGVGC